MAPVARAASFFKGLTWANDRLRNAELQVGRMVPGVIEDWHVIGAAGEPGFLNGWSNYTSAHPMAFYKDPAGFVHVKGLIRNPATPTSYHDVLILPAGYRPSPWVALASEWRSPIAPALQVVITSITSSGQLNLNFGAAKNVDSLALDGLTFRAAV